MSRMRLFSFDHPAHRQAVQLLPWYVNRTLPDSERVKVEEHIRECVACRRELDAQRALAELLRGETASPAMTRGLARLHAELDAAASVGLADRAPWRWWRMGSLLAAAAVIVLAVAVQATFKSAPVEAPYRTLSTQTNGGSADAVVVIFDPTATQQRMQVLLQQVGARVVDGPNARGALTLELPAGTQAEALRRLRGVPEIRFAQPAPGSAGMRP